ncbi:MAG: rhodanese-like domain-containing protein [Betaproteobacteria bacterium]
MSLPQMTVQELQAALAAQSPTRPLLLDVREAWEWQLARIDGSRHLPMREIPARLDDIDKSHPTVVICHHGTRSLQVVAFLQRLGFANLHNLQGGIDAWARVIDPAVPVY